MQQDRAPPTMCKSESLSSESSHNSEEDFMNELVIRAKWQMDGATTLEEAARKIEAFAAYLRSLKADGWELRDEVSDNYGFCRQAS